MIRYVIAAAIAMACIAAGGYVVYAHWMKAPAPVAERARVQPVVVAPLPDASEAPRLARVESVTGVVEKRAGTSWVPVRVGDELTQQDTIRTGRDARAEIDVGASVVVEPSTEITVGEISTHVSEVVLSTGRVSARGHAGATIRIATPDTEALAESTTGSFDVLSSGTGQVTVAARSGSVDVSARGKKVAVPAGAQSIVRRGEAPSKPSAIPPSLFLKVSAAGMDRDISAVRGETTPGAVVTINGVREAPDAAGRFATNVAFPRGENVIVIMVEDATGRQETRVVRRKAAAPVEKPRLETSVDWQ